MFLKISLNSEKNTCVMMQPKNLEDQEIYKTKFHCYLKIADALPIFRGYGQNQGEARKNVCKVAYITEENKSFSAKSSSKKEAKKVAAYKMLQHVLND